MRSSIAAIACLLILFTAKVSCGGRASDPSHLMVGPGLFDVDRTHPKAMAQIEYRWEVHCHHLRPLAAFFITTDTNFFVCGGLGYDIFFGKRVVLTPTFAPGLYYHGHGKNLGFPLNFRSGIELAFILGNRGRIGAQFNHISNAHILYRNPGANSLFIFYAIPVNRPKASGKKSMRSEEVIQ